MQTSSTYQGAMGSLDVGAGVVAGAVESDGVFGGAPVKITGVPDIQVGTVLPVIIMFVESGAWSRCLLRAATGDCDAFRDTAVAHDTNFG